MKLAILVPGGREGRPSHPMLDSTASRLRKTPFSLESIYSMPNITLLTLGAMFKDFGTVALFDGEREPLPSINELSTYDAVFFTGMTYQMEEAFQLAEQLKKQNVLTVAGGVHCTWEANPLPFDSLFMGELEEQLSTFVTHLKNNSLATVYPIKIPTQTEFISPVPLYETLSAGELFPVQLTRGCPWNCNFCVVTNTFGACVRVRPLADVRAIIEKIITIDANPCLFFTDDNMFLNRKWALELLELLKEYPLRFMTHSDLSIAEDEQLLVALKEAGCYAILAGIESTDPQSLQEGSDFKVRQGRVAARRVTQIQSAGIGVIGSFLLGFDHDTTQSVEEIAQFALETKLFELCVKVITPFPGTAMRERLLAEGREVSEEWGKYTARELVFSGSGLTEAEIQEGLQRIQQRYSSVEAVHERIRHFKELWKQQR